MQTYFEIVVGDPSNRGTFAPVELYRERMLGVQGSVVFESYYHYGEEIVLFTSEQGSLAGYEGPRYHNRTVLDLDAAGDLPKAASVAREICQWLAEYGEISDNNIQVWFSGGKGFHIHLPNVFGLEPGPGLPASMKATLESVFSGWEEVLDLSPTAKSGLIRSPWSKHHSGYYKVPVSRQQLAQIAGGELAPDGFATARHFPAQAALLARRSDDEDNGILAHMATNTAAPVNRQQERGRDRPNAMVTCMQKLLIRGPERGRRHQDSLRLVSNWRRQGIPESYCATLLEDWLGEPLGDFARIVNDVFEKGYAYSCRDQVMAEFCDPKCIFYAKKNYTVEVNPASDMGDDYRAYLSSVQAQGLDLVKALGLPGTYKILPGEMAIFTGDTGSGKTALVQQLLCHGQLPTLYLNLEMNRALIYRRFLQTSLQATKEKVNAAVAEGANFTEILSWIDFVHDSPALRDIERLVAQKEYKVLLIDTSDGIDTEGMNEYQALGEIIKTLLSLTQNRNLITVLVHHIRKRERRSSSISLDDLSGNRANVTKMDHVLAIEGGESYKILRSLKSRDSGLLELHMNFDYQTYHFKINDRYEQSYPRDI